MDRSPFRDEVSGVDYSSISPRVARLVPSLPVHEQAIGHRVLEIALDVSDRRRVGRNGGDAPREQVKAPAHVVVNGGQPPCSEACPLESPAHSSFGCIWLLMTGQKRCACHMNFE